MQESGVRSQKQGSKSSRSDIRPFHSGMLRKRCHATINPHNIKKITICLEVEICGKWRKKRPCRKGQRAAQQQTARHGPCLTRSRKAVHHKTGSGAVVGENGPQRRGCCRGLAQGGRSAISKRVARKEEEEVFTYQGAVINTWHYQGQPLFFMRHHHAPAAAQRGKMSPKRYSQPSAKRRAGWIQALPRQCGPDPSLRKREPSSCHPPQSFYSHTPNRQTSCG